MQTIYHSCKHWALLLILLVWTPIKGWTQTEKFDMVVEKTDGTELTFEITDDYPLLRYQYGGEDGVNTIVIQMADGITSVPCPEIKRLTTRAVVFYTLTYMVDGEVYKTVEVEYGDDITAEEEPTKEGYTFSGWGEIPEKMPAKDVTVTGTFTINKYTLTYKVDGEPYKTYEVEYGSNITAEEAPTKEGYTFSGWSIIPTTMPAKDVTITGSFTKGEYQLTYMVDGMVYKAIRMDYGDAIAPETEPDKEGYTFSGWSTIPATMPAKDVTVTGSFTINKYTLTYKVDDEIYKTYEVEYGSVITAEEAPTKEGYTFSGWSEIPATMPAEDVTITGFFTSVDAITDVDAGSVSSIKKVLRNREVIIIRDGKEYDTNGKPTQ